MWGVSASLFLFIALAASYTCPVKVCQTQIGTTCAAQQSTVYQCAQGLYCDNNVCQPSKGIASSCNADKECSYNLGCTLGPQPACNSGSVTIQYSLTSTSAMSAAPYCIGHAFRKGDVPPGQTLSASSPIQVTPRTYYPDGSLKFAMISSVADFSSVSEVKVVLNPVASSSPGGTNLNLSDLQKTGITATTGCGVYGSVTWTWDSPFQVWAEGPMMSSWIFRKPVGTDEHLTAWLEVRLFAGGAVEVLPWVENGYLKVTGSTNKNTTFTFTLGGIQRFSMFFDMKHHTRTVLINGAALSYWLGSDPFITPIHDKKYLQATEQVPAYSAKVSSTNTNLGSLPQTYKPFQQSAYYFSNDNMPATGYAPPIGLLAEFDVFHLVAEDGRTYGSVIRNGYSGGRYATHYRDETTNRPPRFSAHPNLVLHNSCDFFGNGDSSKGQRTPVNTGGSPPVWDIAHSPNIGYVAYLLTGRWYFMEEVQFVATVNFLGQTDLPHRRNGSMNLVHSALGSFQTRATAWDWRALVLALAVTPNSDDVLQTEFISSVQSNIEDFFKMYVVQSNNPYGMVNPGESYDSPETRVIAPWQQDFVTAAFGWSVSLGLPISPLSQAHLEAFFAWKAQSAVFRLGPKDGFWYINAAKYTMVISPSSPNYLNGSGPWYATAAEVYNATYTPPPSTLGNTEGVLSGAYFPSGTAYWGNLMPAIAYAYRHNAPGAKEAWGRLTNATNFYQLLDDFNKQPVWSVTALQANITSCIVPPPGAESLTCSAALNGPGLACTKDFECYFRNTSGLRQTSTCVDNKCYGLAEGAACSGIEQCNLGLYCKASTCALLQDLNNTCTTSQECKNGLFCGNSTASSKVCMAFGQGAVGSLCLDNRYCGDNSFCDQKIKQCTAKVSTASQKPCNTSDNCQGNEICTCEFNTASSVCAPPAANPVGYAKAVQEMYACWTNNPNCRNDVPCDQCSTQICTLYKLSPSFFGDTCGASPTRAAALTACGPVPTTGAGSSTSASPATSGSSASSASTTGEESGAVGNNSLIGVLVLVFIAILLY